jgi:hypothetical protein
MTGNQEIVWMTSEQLGDEYNVAGIMFRYKRKDGGYTYGTNYHPFEFHRALCNNELLLEKPEWAIPVAGREAYFASIASRSDTVETKRKPWWMFWRK